MRRFIDTTLVSGNWVDFTQSEVEEMPSELGQLTRLEKLYVTPPTNPHRLCIVFITVGRDSPLVAADVLCVSPVGSAVRRLLSCGAREEDAFAYPACTPIPALRGHTQRGASRRESVELPTPRRLQ